MIERFKVIAIVDVTHNMMWHTQVEKDFNLFEKGKIYDCEKPSSFGFYTVYYGDGITHETGGWYGELPYDDFVSEMFYKFFKPLSEVRNEKIKKILYK